MGQVKSGGPPPYEPNPEVMELWPEISGNSINGLGETEPRDPRPVFWRTDGTSIAHGEVLLWFYGRHRDREAILAARKRRKATEAIAIEDIAGDVVEKPAGEWSALLRKAALDDEADDIGVCAYRPEWTYDDRPVPRGKWAVVLGFAHDYENMRASPHERAYVEVMDQYARAARAAKFVTNWIRRQGWYAEAKTGPMTEDVLMIPAAIEAGLGELGKHGSMIHRKFGASFRLSMVLTDLPLVPDKPDIFGADLFCGNCQVCAKACPPDAIGAAKQVVRGARKWYVDFDKCLPYFVDNETCGICLAVCPWSRPGIAANLVAKMARRLAARSGT